MKASNTSLPEFERIRLDDITTPVGWTHQWLIFMLHIDCMRLLYQSSIWLMATIGALFNYLCFQHRSIGHYTTLAWCCCTNLWRHIRYIRMAGIMLWWQLPGFHVVVIQNMRLLHYQQLFERDLRYAPISFIDWLIAVFACGVDDMVYLSMEYIPPECDSTIWIDG